MVQQKKTCYRVSEELSFYKEAEHWFRDIEHFIQNEVSTYNWCVVFFLYSLFALFCATIVVSFITNKIKNHIKRR